jgi:protein TonB
MGKLRKFLYLSIVAHLLAMAFIYLAPIRASEEGPAVPYVVRLVEPPPSPPPPPEKVPEQKPPEQREVKPTPARPPEPGARLPKFKEPPNTLLKESGPKEAKPETARKEPAKAEPEKPVAPQDETGAGTPAGSEKAPSSAEGTLPGDREGPSASKGTGEGTDRDKLFDKDIIAMLARKREPPPPSDGITFDTREFRYRSYMLRLKERIEGIWKYPPEAARRGIYGDLYIKFVIKKNGRLESAEVLRTSGMKMLDEAALRALKDAEPYWPLPEDWQEDSLTITGHFVYSLWGSYVR